MKIERFEDIEAWQLARELTRKVYCLTKKAGFAKDYGLNRQIRENFQVHSSTVQACPGATHHALYNASSEDCA